MKIGVAGVVALVLAGTCGSAYAQFLPNSAERFNAASAALGNGLDDADGDNFSAMGPWVHTANVGVAEPNGGGAESTASQNSMVSGNLVSGSLNALTSVRTGSTFITGEGQSQSNFVFIFSLAAPTPVSLTGNASINLVGVNPDGEPSDLYGRAHVKLLDGDTSDEIAGISLFPSAGSLTLSYSATLPAGNYVLLANAFSYAFSADLLGPPARSGSGNSHVDFSLTVVPAPGAAMVLGLGGLLAARRRR